MAVNIIDTQEALAITDPEIINEIMSGVRKSSVVMQLGKKLPNMTTNQRTQPLLSMLPVADFVDGTTGMKTTSKAAWEKMSMTVGEIACIVPIPDAVNADSQYDLFAEVLPLITESLGRVFDNQVFNGGNPKAPAEWPEALITKATSLGKTVALGTGQDVAFDISQAMAILEDDEYEITGIASQRSLIAKMRDLRTTTGDVLYQPVANGQPSSIYGNQSIFVPKGTWDKTTATAIMGDWSKLVYSMRQDITVQKFTEGVISDDDGKIIYNLMMQDMSAMRVVMRLAWNLIDEIDIDRPLGSSYPFALLTPQSGVTNSVA